MTDTAVNPVAGERRALVEPGHLARSIGLAAVAFSAIYLLSDVIEVAQGGFSTVRLLLTYAGEVTIPLFVIGLYGMQRPRIGRIGLLGAVLYAYSYVFFTSTVVFALVAGTPDYSSLTSQFGPWMTVHGAVMLIGGVMFGSAVVRAGIFPRWTGICLMIGVVAVAAVSGWSNLVRAIAEILPSVAFGGMGVALLRRV